MDDLSIYVQKCLKSILEEFGVKDFSNKAYDKECENIALTIYKEFNNPKMNYKYDLFQDDNLVISKLCRIIKPLNSVKWIRKINIYLTTGSYFDSYVLMNTMAYLMNNMYKLVPVNYKFQIINSDEEIDDFFDIYDDGIIRCINNATIVIQVPELIYPVNVLKMIIKHELGHLADMLFNKETIVKQNSDTLELLFLSYDNVHASQVEYFINSSIDYNLRKDTLLKKTPSGLYLYLTYELISDSVAYLLYLINKSELRQRLNNFESDILYDLKTGTELHVHTPERIELYLIDNSETYRLYLGIVLFFKMLVKYTPNKIKQLFATVDIKSIYDKTRNNDDSIKKPYGNKIKFTDSNNQYSDVSFDIFFNMHINNIDNIFLHNALSMSLNALFESPYKQRHYPFLV